MKQRSEKWERLVALFVIGFVSFNFPVIALFDSKQTIAGIPIFYLYLFTLWGVLIAIAAWIVEGRR